MQSGKTRLAPTKGVCLRVQCRTSCQGRCLPLDSVCGYSRGGQKTAKKKPIMLKNGSITSFFKPMPRPSQGSQPDSSPQPQSHPRTIRPRTPPQPQSAPQRSPSPPTPQHLPLGGTFSPNKEPKTP